MQRLDIWFISNTEISSTGWTVQLHDRRFVIICREKKEALPDNEIQLSHLDVIHDVEHEIQHDGDVKR